MIDAVYSCRSVYSIGLDGAKIVAPESLNSHDAARLPTGSAISTDCRITAAARATAATASGCSVSSCRSCPTYGAFIVHYSNSARAASAAAD